MAEGHLAKGNRSIVVIMDEFNIRLKKFRIASGLSQRAAAKGIGVAQSTYREWEYGRAISGSKHYPKIARTFNISLEELFGISKTPNESPSDLLERVLRDVARAKGMVSSHSKKKE